MASVQTLGSSSADMAPVIPSDEDASSGGSGPRKQKVGMPFLSIYEEGPANDKRGSEIQDLPMEAVPPLYPDWESQARQSIEFPAHIKREQWANKLEFLLVLLSIAVGLGNVWKFPFEAYDNGGGAFLIPYLIIVTLIARPLYFIEIAIGQFCSRGPVGVWDSVPLVRGVGWSIFCVSTLLSLFYLAILAWCAMFFFHSFENPLPWSKCNTEDYCNQGLDADMFRNNCMYFECRKIGAEWFGSYFYQDENGTGHMVDIPAPVFFFVYKILGARHDISEGIGMPHWENTLALFILWFVVFLVMIFGTKSTGKVAYFTAIFPYLVLFILFIRAVTLDGAAQGIIAFLKPDFTKIFKLEVWFKATNQAFFSLGIGFGSAIVSGSYNPFRQKTYNDALLIGLADTFTSVLAGLTIFSILGVLANNLNVDVTKVVKGGPGLAFVAYPQLMLHFGDYPGPQIFSVLFFSMLLTLGVGSAVSFLHVFTATILDKIPILGAKQWYKICLVGALCTVSFLVGLIFCTPGAGQMVSLFDVFGAGFVVFFIAMTEISALAYIYGMKNLERDFRFMFSDYKCLKFKCDFNCQLLRYWGYGIPVLFFMLFIYVCTIFDTNMALADKDLMDKVYLPPMWVKVFGWMMFTLVVAIIPIYAIAVFFSRKSRSFYKKWMASITPSRHWGPKIPEEKLQWVQFKKEYDGDSWCWKRTFGKLFGKMQAPNVNEWKPGAEVPEEEGLGDEPSMVNSVDGAPEELESVENAA